MIGVSHKFIDRLREVYKEIEIWVKAEENGILNYL